MQPDNEMQHHNWLDEEYEDDQYDISNNLIQESAYEIDSFPSKDVGSKQKINIINILLCSCLFMFTILIFTWNFHIFHIIHHAEIADQHICIQNHDQL